MERPLRCRLHVMSPVHIGCGDVYEPTGFVIDEKKKKLIEFDPMDFIKSLSREDKQRFTAICMQGSISAIVNIYKFVSGRQIVGREVEIASDLSEHYKKVRNLPSGNERIIRQELNQFAIGRTAYNPYSGLLYIPGSSIKGALRTTYLSQLAKERSIVNYWDKSLHKSELQSDERKYKSIGAKKVAKKLEKDLLGGDFDKDSFRMVKVSDFIPARDVKAKIFYTVNKKKKPSKFDARGPFQIVETVKEGAVFEGMINVYQPDQRAGITKSVTPKDLLKSANDFYILRFNEENKVLKGIGAGSIVLQIIKQSFNGKLGKTAFLLRVGRHSGAEAVTVEGNRYIKIMQGRNQPSKFLDHATTIWLASETSKPSSNNSLLPFGWVVLEIL